MQGAAFHTRIGRFPEYTYMVFITKKGGFCVLLPKRFIIEFFPLVYGAYRRHEKRVLESFYGSRRFITLFTRCHAEPVYSGPQPRINIRSYHPFFAFLNLALNSACYVFHTSAFLCDRPCKIWLRGQVIQLLAFQISHFSFLLSEFRSK